MTTIPSLILAGIACILPAIAAEPDKPAVTLNVKNTSWIRTATSAACGAAPNRKPFPCVSRS